jgi:cupin superfamily acireductone dioxygenase involved in methionine salvage
VAVLQIPDQHRTLHEHTEIRDYLAGIGIEYERWQLADSVAPDASAPMGRRSSSSRNKADM